jgi:hypothetical protein
VKLLLCLLYQVRASTPKDVPAEVFACDYRIAAHKLLSAAVRTRELSRLCNQRELERELDQVHSAGYL